MWKVAPRSKVSLTLDTKQLVRGCQGESLHPEMRPRVHGSCYTTLIQKIFSVVGTAKLGVVNKTDINLCLLNFHGIKYKITQSSFLRYDNKSLSN